MTTAARFRATPKRRALVIGGSLGGLFAGAMLQRAGWDVDIYERSPHDLGTRGGGIVLQPDVVEVLRRVGIDTTHMDLGVRSRYRTVFRPDGAVESRNFAPQCQTSWSLIYTAMKRVFGKEHYVLGKKLVDLRQGGEPGRTVTAVFEDGAKETGGLLVGADGSNSTVRRLLWPEVKPDYAGYFAWSGLLPEAEMSGIARTALHGDFGFANNKSSHILGYLVPGPDSDTREGRRLYNWVWYRVADEEQLRDIMTDRDGSYNHFSIPEGKLAPKWREHLRKEADILCCRPLSVKLSRPRASRSLKGFSTLRYIVWSITG